MPVRLRTHERQWLSRMIPEVRVRRLGARIALRRLLGERLKVPPDSVELQHGPWGKPFLHPAHGSRTEFNVSHAGDWAVIAVGEARNLGIDIERVTENDDYEMLADRIMSARELNWYDKLLAGERCLAFYRAWVRKEAVLKATGCGLSLDPRMIDVHNGLGWLYSIPLPGATSGECLELLDIQAPPEYVGALVCRSAEIDRRGCRQSIAYSHHPVY